VKKSDKVWSLPLAGGALGAFAALMLAVPVAHADPDAPAPPPPGPSPLLPGPEQSISTQAAADDPALPALKRREQELLQRYAKEGAP